MQLIRVVPQIKIDDPPTVISAKRTRYADGTLDPDCQSDGYHVMLLRTRQPPLAAKIRVLDRLP
jgi:hypothetical protein